MAEIRTLKLNLLADVSEFSRGLESSQKKLKRFGKSVDQSFKKTAILAAGLGAAAFKFVEAGEKPAQRLTHVFYKLTRVWVYLAIRLKA
jgi:hypothetical protein